MSKKAFWTLISAFLLIFLLFGCEKNGSCTVTKSYGTNSFTKDTANTCVTKLAGATCYKNSSQEDIANIVTGLQKYELVFNKKKCYDFYEKDEFDNYKRVECPDIIPKKIKILQLSGCNIYYDGDNEHTGCETPCPEIYFSTDNDMFKTVAYKDDWGDLAWFSQSADGKTSFSSSLDYQKARHTIFSWHETAEDGREIEKSVRIEMETGNSDTPENEDKVLAQCEDSEGRIYKEGDKIPDECRIMTCSSDGNWVPHQINCYGECDAEISDQMDWTCSDEATDIHWCTCVEDEEFGSRWNCVERPDLNCPEE